MSEKAKCTTYPNVRRDDTVEEEHFGAVVSDPYRWLEDPFAEETKKFVAEQNQLTAAQFEKHVPYQKEYKARLTEVFNYEKYSLPFQIGSEIVAEHQYYVQAKNDGLQNQDVWYIQRTLHGQAQVLFDPNQLSQDGTIALSNVSFSECKQSSTNPRLYMAYGISQGGSDWQNIHVLDVTKYLKRSLNEEKSHFSDYILEDKLDWVKFSSISWTHDEKGFFYCRYPAPTQFEGSKATQHQNEKGTETNANSNHQIWYHRLYRPQEDDVLVFAYPSKPNYTLSTEVSEDGKYLIIYLFDGCKNANMVYLTPITVFDTWMLDHIEKHVPVYKLVDVMEYSCHYILNDESIFYFQTNLNAPRERIVKIDVGILLSSHTFGLDASGDSPSWVEVIREQPELIVLESVYPARKNVLILKLLSDVHNVLHIYSLDGDLLTKIDLPGIGTVQVSSRRASSIVFYKFVSFLYPGTIFHLDLPSSQNTELPRLEGVCFRESNLKDFDASQYEVIQVFYPSKDGTKIPMFLVKHKSLKSDGSIPTYLYGYGGFNIALKPSFSVSRLLFVQHFKGMLAIANIRGGGEYGEEWHRQGMLLKKQNVFDDFHAAAEYLIEQKYTNPSKIAIHGGSNGGTLVAACANQRPDLYRCVVGAVGVMDMLRFHLFTIGHAWISEYGDPSTEEYFSYLRKYSPLHNVPKKSPGIDYPAVLLTTGDHDDRVVPLHSYKYISELQHQLGGICKNPFVIRIDTKSGHGAGKPTAKQIEESTDVCTFMAWCLNTEFCR
uniref:Prolyl endopeptidase n=1 Tax=Albugo laibachii Nc14 TaxID=890382 RepID=F0WN55_9STRA|nr:unnamed protein product putative [Albugo laibachii Nc14]|eukprot:CCA22744.1 unnamed protein product putative [Albugo laibachii Nc14]